MCFSLRRFAIVVVAAAPSATTACTVAVGNFTERPTPLNGQGADAVVVALVAILGTVWILGRKW